MKIIKTSDGDDVYVDDEDFDYLNLFSWYTRNGRYTKYASKSKNNMHRMILKVNDPNIIVDHIDGNGLNNQKSNLRLATAYQNLLNSRPQKNNKSGFKGVRSPDKYTKKYRASISKNNKIIHLGYFLTKEEAAKAYDDAARYYFGEFAYLNFPDKKI